MKITSVPFRPVRGKVRMGGASPGLMWGAHGDTSNMPLSYSSQNAAFYGKLVAEPAVGFERVCRQAFAPEEWLLDLTDRFKPLVENLL